MNELITIETKKFEELCKEAVKLDLIKQLAEADKNEYGYANGTSKVIDAILGIERKERVEANERTMKGE